jgi:hypothetical protein
MEELLHAHVEGATHGLVAGLLLATGFAAAQAAPVISSPLDSAIGFGLVGLMIGSLVAGIAALRDPK